MTTRQSDLCARILALLACAGVASSAAAQWTTLDIRRIGLTDAEHSQGGIKPMEYSGVADVNDAGQAIGSSWRWAKGKGESAWFWSPQTGTVRINPVDTAHISRSGERVGVALALNASGQVVGLSRLYDPAINVFGTDSWSWTPQGGLVAIGYSHPLDTSPLYARVSSPAWKDWTPKPCILNSAGAVIGMYYDNKWSPANFQPMYAWVWSESFGNVRLGLLDADHTQSDGTKLSETTLINDAGTVAGTSERRKTGSRVGRSAWVCTAPQNYTQNYTRLGLFDGVHVAPDDYQFSEPRVLTPGGRVAGQSKRFLGDFDGGASAWVWSPELGTQPVGLTDAAHTRADGYQVNDILALDDAGRMYGTAQSFSGSQQASSAVWFKAPDTGYITVGLDGPVHTGPTGGIASLFVRMNASGQAVGNSVRFNGSASAGKSGWFYDPASNTLWPLIFSVSTAGVANTTITFLSDDGIVAGHYELYQGNTLLGTRPFLWSRQNGMADLATLIDGGLASHGWIELNTIDAGSNTGYYVGTGSRVDNLGWTSAFILSPHRCLADRDRDNQVTLDDFLAYFECWDASAPCADVDDTQGTTLEDFFTFLGHWDSGC